MPFEDQITDDALLNAVRKRLMRELMAERGQSPPNIDIQNIVGGGRGGEPQLPPGMFEGMRGGESAEPEMDYGVDITRSDMWADPANQGQFLPPGVMPEPVDGKYPDPIGWRKSVQRYRAPRGQEIETQKKK